jgi:hypothetical protein
LLPAPSVPILSLLPNTERLGWFGRRQDAGDTRRQHRLACAKLKLRSADPEERLLARASIAQEFRQIIDTMTSDRRIIVRPRVATHANSRWATLRTATYSGY